eukprot:ctg_410.g220
MRTARRSDTDLPSLAAQGDFPDDVLTSSSPVTPSSLTSRVFFAEEVDAAAVRAEALSEYRKRALSVSGPVTASREHFRNVSRTGRGSWPTPTSPTTQHARPTTDLSLTRAHIARPPDMLRERVLIFLIDYDDTLYPTTQLESTVLRVCTLRRFAAAPASAMARDTPVGLVGDAVFERNLPFPTANAVQDTGGHPGGAETSLTPKPLSRTSSTTTRRSSDDLNRDLLRRTASDLYQSCLKLDAAVCDFLQQCSNLAPSAYVRLVTNADLRWVYTSTRDTMPRVHRLLFAGAGGMLAAARPPNTWWCSSGGVHTFQCVSARCRYGDLRSDGKPPVSDEPTQWKVACFKAEIEAVLAEHHELARRWQTWQSLMRTPSTDKEAWCEQPQCVQCGAEHDQFLARHRQAPGVARHTIPLESFENTPFDLVVVGDSAYEMEAARQVREHFPAARLITIKLFEEPTMPEITQQLTVLTQRLRSLMATADDLNVQLVLKTSAVNRC